MSDDGFIQVPIDQAGKKVDTTEITRTDTAETVVERQRIEVRDEDDNVLSTSDITSEVELTNDILFRILDKLDDIQTLLIRRG